MGERARVLLTEPISSAGIQLLQEVADVEVAGVTDPDLLIERTSGVDALIVRSTEVPARLIESAAQQRLRVIGRHGAGTDNIDIDAAHRCGVAVVSTPGANAESVAEFVILAAMTMLRRLPQAVTALSAGALRGGSLPAGVVAAGLTGSMLNGRTLGVVGLGAIGRHAATLGRAMGMEVLGYDPMAPDLGAAVRRVGLDEVLGSSDAITLHVPHTAETHHLIDSRALTRMRSDAVLINTARAGVVDTAAVIERLDHGDLAGYAVDVFDPEPPPRGDALLTHPGVLASPHMAAMTTQALDAMARAVATRVIAQLTK